MPRFSLDSQNLAGSWGKVIIADDYKTVNKTQRARPSVLNSIAQEIYLGSIFPFIVAPTNVVYHNNNTVSSTMPFAGIDVFRLVKFNSDDFAFHNRVSCLKQLAHFMATLTTHGILIHDIKPNNMCFSTPGGRSVLKLIDTGMFCSMLPQHKIINDEGMRWHEYVPPNLGKWTLSRDTLSTFYTFSWKRHAHFFLTGSPIPPKTPQRKPIPDIPPHMDPMLNAKSIFQIANDDLWVW